MRLLIVEDEFELAQAVARGLRRRGHGVDLVGDVRQAEIRLGSTAYDIVLLDRNLPDGDGLDVCRRLKDGRLATLDGTVPRILILTARDEVEDRVEGLDAGADDYLVKPFAFAELEARVRVLSRRVESGAPRLGFGPVSLDPARFEVEVDGERVVLAPKEFALLEYFLQHPGIVFRAEDLLEHVWDEATDPFTNTVRVTISNLRKKLGVPDFIETIPGRGYVVRPSGS